MTTHRVECECGRVNEFECTRRKGPNSEGAYDGKKAKVLSVMKQLVFAELEKKGCVGYETGLTSKALWKLVCEPYKQMYGKYPVMSGTRADISRMIKPGFIRCSKTPIELVDRPQLQFRPKGEFRYWITPESRERFAAFPKAEFP